MSDGYDRGPYRVPIEKVWWCEKCGDTTRCYQSWDDTPLQCCRCETTRVLLIPALAAEIRAGLLRLVAKGRRFGWGEHLSQEALFAVGRERHQLDWLPPRCYSIWGLVAAFEKAARRAEGRK